MAEWTMEAPMHIPCGLHLASQWQASCANLSIQQWHVLARIVVHLDVNSLELALITDVSALINNTRQMEALQAKLLLVYCSLYTCFTTKHLDKLHRQFFFLQVLHSKYLDLVV
jgi:hypothetical protein